MRPSFFRHLHPPSIPARLARWRYALGAGGTAVFMTCVVGATGMLEMYDYVPTPDQAAPSVQTITYLLPFGNLMRNLPYWSAKLLVLVETLAALITAAVLVLLSAFVPAPIASPISNLAGVWPLARALSCFLWVQHLHKWGDPFHLRIAVPLILLMLPAIVPFALPPPKAYEFGHWFARSNRLAQLFPLGIAVGVATLTTLGSIPAG